MPELGEPNAECIALWGVRFAPFTMDQAIDRIRQLIDFGQPSYVVTANLHYTMLSHQRSDLREVNRGAAFIVADGMPLVWASRLQKTPLPQRVAGSDLIWNLCEQAANLGQRVFLLGGAPGIAEEAGRKLVERFPALSIVGTECPPFRVLSEAEEEDLLQRIREARPQLLIVALGQPKGELWIARVCAKLNGPVCIQLGASLDFVAGKVHRAPRWMQRIGLEWAFRLAQEPRRLLGRYVRNGAFLVRMLLSSTRRKGFQGSHLAPRDD